MTINEIMNVQIITASKRIQELIEAPEFSLVNIKYVTEQPKALIYFGMKQLKEKPIYIVQDSGVGFDMKYAQKLFGTFQHLYTDTNFSGTGVGLVIV